MAQVKISDGTRVVTLEEVPEQRPAPPLGMEVLPDITGGPVVYERTGKLREVPLSGRVKSKAEAAYLEDFLNEDCALELTERDGTVTSDWRVKSDPLRSYAARTAIRPTGW
jgi:hypothetical protein